MWIIENGLNIYDRFDIYVYRTSFWYAWLSMKIKVLNLCNDFFMLLGAYSITQIGHHITILAYFEIPDKNMLCYYIP